MSTAAASAPNSDRRFWVGLAALVAGNLGLSAMCCLILNYEPPSPPPTFLEIVAFIGALAFLFAQVALLGSFAGATNDRRAHGGIALGLTVTFAGAMWWTNQMEAEGVVAGVSVVAANLLAYSFVAALLVQRLAGCELSKSWRTGQIQVHRKLSIKDLLLVMASICLPLAAVQAILPTDVAVIVVSGLALFSIIAVIAIPWGLAITAKKRWSLWLLLALGLTICPALVPWTFASILRHWRMPRIIGSETFTYWMEWSWFWSGMLFGAALGTTLAVVGNLLALQWLGLQWRRPASTNRKK